MMNGMGVKEQLGCEDDGEDKREGVKDHSGTVATNQQEGIDWMNGVNEKMDHIEPLRS
jgi:hypothetical protein